MDTRINQNVAMTDAPMSNDHDDGHNHNNNEKVSSPLLNGLPIEMRNEEIYSYLLPKELGLFAQTSRQAEQETAFSRLLPSAVDAEPESYNQADETKLAAIAILKRHPELLFECRGGRVTDHFGRRLKGSPYRLLLGAGDTWALKQVHEEIIPNIEDGEALAKLEFQAQFPSCSWPLTLHMLEEALYDDRNKAQIRQVISQLEIIVANIDSDPCTHSQATRDETIKAVADLCQIFAPKEGEIIETGLHFPLGLMKEIGKVYVTQSVSWDFDQLAFFSRTVIGEAEAALTAVDGQCYKNGQVNLNMAQGPDRRDGLFCRHPKGIPQKLAPLAGKLGRSMFVDPYDGYSCVLSSNPGVFDWYNKDGRGRLLLESESIGCMGLVDKMADNLMENKSSGVWELMRPDRENSTHRLEGHDRSMRCVIL